MYDYFLGGETNWAIDRAAAERAIELLPWVRDMAKANRAFLRRAVRYCLAEGIAQFVDIGSGIPTVGNVHEVAGELNPRSKVVYVDNEPVAIAHGQVQLEQTGEPGRHGMVQADLRDPDQLWQRVLDTGILDPARPTALLVVAVLHFIPDEEWPQAALADYRQRLAPGSALVLSHGTLDAVTPAQQEQLDAYTRHYAKTQNPLVWRSRTEFAEFLGDYPLVEPGITWVPDWRPDPTIAPELRTDLTDPSQSMVYAAVGRKP
ncbi:methyltransferase [Amycolatopsis acidicola]|uniref:Methyltransferase n=2 Tax=Amycolatopsis acidicola TaxID=2596893 RepID=A0A5N0UV24_9PSEU|nr:methyltransferase [Amycolatopsis acidicola]